MFNAIIIGGGLAGSEAAWQLAARDISVTLYEMRPQRNTKAHKTDSLAELVCSNSFRGAALTNAVGLLKEELRLLGSLIMQAADFAKVPAGGALAVDRIKFSNFVQSKLEAHPRIEIIRKEIEEIPLPAKNTTAVIICSGPLTSPALMKAIETLVGEMHLAFFDAISPIILGESIDLNRVFRMSRYEKGDGDDYLNIPLDKDSYERFVREILAAEKFGGHEEVESDCIDNLRPFEGCMPIEDMATRGPETLRFGPFKPVGLTDPATGKRPYAVVQLRQDDSAGKLWSMVGLQTKMKQGEQLRIFRSLPGLEKAEFVRLGSVHRNSFIESPKCLDATLMLRNNPGMFFGGQITGVEGYVESTASGLLSGINASKWLSDKDMLVFPASTAIGGLHNYISDPGRKNFQPMNISFGLIDSYQQAASGLEQNKHQKKQKLSKKERREKTSEHALKLIQETLTRILHESP